MARSAGLLAGRRTKWLVIVFWLVVVGVAGPLAGKLTGVEKNDAKSWLPGSAESTKVLEIQQSFQSPDAIMAVIVYERPGGLADGDLPKAKEDAAKLGELEGVQGEPSGPIPSDDGAALETLVTFDLGPNGWDKAADIGDKIKAITTADADGLNSYLTGPMGNAVDSAEAFEGIDGTLLFATIGVVVVILLLIYRSPVLWLLPVISAGTALTVAQGVIYLFAKHAGLTVNAQSAGILTVLVFGAGTDYALLLVARYREELRRHENRHEAMAVALHRAGPAIIASAATVIAGMLCLLVAEMNSTRGLGPVSAIGVLVGLLVMLTLLPALLVACGRWVFWPRRPAFGTTEPTATGFWAGIGNRISRRARTVWIVTALILGALSFGLTSLDATGLTNAESFRGEPESIVGEEVVARHYDAGGAGSPVVVVAKESAGDQVKSAFEDVPGIAEVGDITRKNGVAYMEGILQDAPDSQSAFSTIDRARDAVHAVPDADAQVGGNTAVNLDIRRAAQHDEKLIIPIILAVVLIILMVLLRSVLAPVLLVATVVLSFAAALGASGLIFTHVFNFGGADSGLPLFVFVFLVALGIDYNIFLMTRVREEAQQHGTRRGALIGLAATGGVITSAGVVLAGTFAVLATLPLTAFAEIGFAVALGVLLDTIVVRAVLVTALNMDLGAKIWWPSALTKKPDAPTDSGALREEELVHPA